MLLSKMVAKLRTFPCNLFTESSDDIYINMRSACMTTVMTFSQNYNYSNKGNDDVIMSSEPYSSRIFSYL